MKTARKMAVARQLSRIVLAARRLVGKGPVGTFRRGGLLWQLDLREGIDLAIYLMGGFEREALCAYSRLVRPGDTVVDIGANVGAHTLPLAALVGDAGRVVAIEPTDYAVEKMRRSIALNDGIAKRISVVQALLVDGERQRAPSMVHSSWPLEEAGEVHPVHRGRLMPVSRARVITLDEILGELGHSRIDVIKLDVDGAELGVLRGASHTLRAWRPLIIMELAPHVHEERGSSLGELVSLVTTFGYEFRDLATERPLPAEARELAKVIPAGGSINVIARPV